MPRKTQGPPWFGVKTCRHWGINYMRDNQIGGSKGGRGRREWGRRTSVESFLDVDSGIVPKIRVPDSLSLYRPLVPILFHSTTSLWYVKPTFHFPTGFGLSKMFLFGGSKVQRGIDWNVFVLRWVSNVQLLYSLLTDFSLVTSIPWEVLSEKIISYFLHCLITTCVEPI